MFFKSPIRSATSTLKKNSKSPKLVVGSPQKQETFLQQSMEIVDVLVENVQQQRQTLEIVKDFACEAKIIGNIQRFRISMFYVHVFQLFFLLLSFLIFMFFIFLFRGFQNVAHSFHVFVSFSLFFVSGFVCFSWIVLHHACFSLVFLFFLFLLFFFFFLLFSCYIIHVTAIDAPFCQKMRDLWITEF